MLTFIEECKYPENIKPNLPMKDRIMQGPRYTPQKFSIVFAVNLYSFISISEYQISTPFSYVNLVQFLPFISCCEAAIYSCAVASIGVLDLGFSVCFQQFFNPNDDHCGQRLSGF